MIGHVAVAESFAVDLTTVPGIAGNTMGSVLTWLGVGEVKYEAKTFGPAEASYLDIDRGKYLFIPSKGIVVVRKRRSLEPRKADARGTTSQGLDYLEHCIGTAMLQFGISMTALGEMSSRQKFEYMAKAGRNWAEFYNVRVDSSYDRL